MKKIIYLFFIIYLTFFMYSIIDGSVSESFKNRRENIKNYNETINYIKDINAQYKVMSGRMGGTFTFKIKINESKDFDLFLELIGKNWIRDNLSSKYIIFCKKVSGIRISRYTEVEFILEYERKPSECEIK